LSITTPFPGTKLYEEALQLGLIGGEEEFLYNLEQGYRTDKYLVNFTNFSEEEFYKKREVTTEKIFVNYTKYLKTHPDAAFRALLSYAKKYGMKKALNRIISL